MTKETRNFRILVFTIFMFLPHIVYAAPINLNSPTIMGGLKLSNGQLIKIKDAVVKAMSGNIDAEIQCGEATLDCVVRAARQWSYEGSTFREIVVDIHTVGHASFTVEKATGQGWPSITVDGEGKQPEKKK